MLRCKVHQAVKEGHLTQEYDLYRGESLVTQLLPENKAMACHALTSGKKLDGKLMVKLAAVEQNLKILQGENSEAEATMTWVDCAGHLSTIHGHLCEVIAPASPRTILLLTEEMQDNRKFVYWGPIPLIYRSLAVAIGPVPLIRKMLLVSILSLFSLLLISLSPYVDGKHSSYSFTQNSGLPLLANFAFLFAAASLGASFSSLFLASKYVEGGTFDPKFDQSYWNRLLLGAMAGLIIAFFVPIAESSTKGMGKPLLAMLGGFSSAAVHRILSRIVGSMEALFKGDPKEIIANVEEQAKTKRARNESQVRLEISSQLSLLRRKVEQDADPSELLATLDQIQDQLLDGNTRTQLSTYLGEPEFKPLPKSVATATSETPEPEASDQDGEPASGENA